jgi:hypothetical protein
LIAASLRNDDRNQDGRATLKTNEMKNKLKAEHGIVCSKPHDRFGYFGWPTVARMDDGELVVASSGLRTWHVDPYGKTVVLSSRDDGRTWSEPAIVGDLPIDNRDGGIVCLGGRKRLVTWFTSDTRKLVDDVRQHYLEHVGGEEGIASWQTTLSRWTDEAVANSLGSWLRLSDDGNSWSEPIRAPVSAPHGPIRLRNGDLLYLGTRWTQPPNGDGSAIAAARSRDGGRTWAEIGSVKNTPASTTVEYCEPHVVELPSGKLIGLIRYGYQTDKFYDDYSNPKIFDQSEYMNFSMWQTDSLDGGRTWSDARPTNVRGLPPHLLRHSSGALICTYGHRHEPWSHRVMISRDEGRTWDAGYTVRHALDGDIGYGSTIELSGGRLFSVYYQKLAKGEKNALLWSRWELP